MYLICSIFALILFPLTSHFYNDHDLKLIFLFISSVLFINFSIFKLQCNNKEKFYFVRYISIIIFFILLITILFQWYISNYQYYSTRSLIFIFTCITSFLSAIFTNKTQFNILIKSLVILLSISSLYAILEYFNIITPYEIRKFPVEITGHIGHKNIFAFIAMVALIWNIYFIISYKKNIYYITIIPIILALLISDSRGSILLAVFGIILIFIPYLIKYKIYKKFKYRLIFYIAIMVITFIPIFFWNEKTLIRLVEIFINTNTLSHRSEIYKAQWNMFLDNPLFGSGLGSFIHENYFYWTNWMKEHMPIDMITYNGHCEYLEVLSEFGLTGFSFYFYFWFLAIYKLIKYLKQNWDFKNYVHLIILIMMMLHATFSVASKRTPTSAVLWFHIGYIFKDEFQLYLHSLSSKAKSYHIIIFNILSISIMLLFTQLLLADFFYKSSRIGISPNKNSIINLKKSLDIYPTHPYSLYQTARFSMGIKDYNYTINACNELIENSPNIFPLYYLKSEALFAIEQFDSSLYYVNKELYLHPKYLEAVELKCRILSKLNKCEDLNTIKQFYNYIYPNKNIKLSQFQIDSINNYTFNNYIGKLRSTLFKKQFHKSWEKHKKFQKFKTSKNPDLIYKIKKMPCNENKFK